MKIRTWSIVLVLIVATVVGGYLYLQSAPSNSASCREQLPQPTIIAFGDSLVAGYGATTQGGFITMLSRDIGIPIQNLGVNGDTTNAARTRLAQVTAVNPDITILLLGGNDALRRVSQAETEENLRAIIETLQEANSNVLLLGVIGGFPDPYAAMYQRLADEYDLEYVPNVLSGIITSRELMYDQVHPNEAGYERIAEKVLPQIAELCGR